MSLPRNTASTYALPGYSSKPPTANHMSWRASRKSPAPQGHASLTIVARESSQVVPSMPTGQAARMPYDASDAGSFMASRISSGVYSRSVPEMMFHLGARCKTPSLNSSASIWSKKSKEDVWICCENVPSFCPSNSNVLGHILEK